ncbi:MAG: hypothetical protein AB7U97_14480 [Pirellulales bacterium]
MNRFCKPAGTAGLFGLLLATFVAATAAAQETRELPIDGRVDVTPALAPLLDRINKLEARCTAQDELLAGINRTRTTPCEFNLLDAGCRLNDPTFDNGPILNELLRKMGGNFGDQKGWINTSLYLPAGGCWFKTPIETLGKTGLRLRGNGLANVQNENAYWSPNLAALGGPASRLIYVGDPATPAIRLHGLGDIWDGVVLQNGQQPNVRQTVVSDGSVGIEMAGDHQPPQGKVEFRSLAVHGFETAIHAVGDVGGHADESEVGFGWFQDCRTVFHSDCPQTVCWHFRKLAVAGLAETVFDFQGGGSMSCEQLSLMAKALVFRIAKPAEHTAEFRLNHLKVDAGPSSGWRLLDVQQAWLLKFYCWGFIGRGAVPAADAVVIRGPAGRQFIEIDMVDGNTSTQWDWKKNAKLETTK